ncbi:hypothetical protein KP509_05G049100 [Ceratopteris richardii]|uniref:Small ribosomal subunit protein uS8c n=1 Tax=Ceratopteris richardii TaxID=49495 RepID=A0A8T2UQE6_CERRI|nr:hypothetical protein KP509_05G049100 [Ceratopteris richardii]
MQIQKKKDMIRIPATKMTKNIVQILLAEGFLKSVTEHRENKKDFLDIRLKYFGRKKEPYITEIKSISKPGLKVHYDGKNTPKILGGMGIAILSTSCGLLTDREARQQKIGGEILCNVW